LILDTNVFLTFKGHGAELEELRVQAQVLELEHLLEVEWQVLILHREIFCIIMKKYVGCHA